MDRVRTGVWTVGLVFMTLLGLVWARGDAAGGTGNRVTIVDQGRLVMLEGTARVMEGSYTLYSDGRVEASWKSLAEPGQPVAQCVMRTRGGKIIQAIHKSDDTLETVSFAEGKIKWQRGQRSEEFSAPHGAFLYHGTFWHTWVVLMRYYDFKKGVEQEFPAFACGGVVGMCTIRVTPVGIDRVVVAGREQQAWHFKCRPLFGQVYLGGEVEVWTSPSGRFLKGTWPPLEVHQE